MCRVSVDEAEWVTIVRWIGEDACTITGFSRHDSKWR